MRAGTLPVLSKLSELAATRPLPVAGAGAAAVMQQSDALRRHAAYQDWPSSLAHIPCRCDAVGAINLARHRIAVKGKSFREIAGRGRHRRTRPMQPDVAHRP